MRAVIYTRISRDAEERGLGVARQEADCRALCERLGWEIVAVHTDNDISASSGKHRPGYEAVLEAIRSGEAAAVVAYHPDRLYRRMLDLEGFITVVEAAGAKVVTVTAGDFDLSTPSGRHVARILGSTAQAEAERIGERIRRKHLELAENGRDSGGGSRPYGYVRGAGGLEIVEDEAQVIRGCARRLLAGEGVYTLVRDLNRRAIPTSTGKEWSTHSLRRALTRPGTAGKREHRGEIVAAAQWEPILDETTWELVRARLKDNGDRRKRQRAPRSYLMNGRLLKCGACGAPMKPQPADDKRRYRCLVLPPSNGCGRLSVDAERLEGFVRDVVFTALEGPLLERVLAARAGTDERLREKLEEAEKIEAQRELDEADFVEGRLDRPTFLRLDQKRRERLERLRSEAARLADRRPLAELPRGEDLRGWWEQASLEKQRALIGAVVDHVEVGPHPGPNRAVWDVSRFTVVWRA